MNHNPLASGSWSFIERSMLKGLRCFDPEIAHNLSICALQRAPHIPEILPSHPALRTKIGSIALENPLGIAAGFDKNGKLSKQLIQCGFGHTEVGTITPLPQKGNPKPRIFRLREDKGIINRMGFCNDGAEEIKKRLPTKSQRKGIIGINIGANATSKDRIHDYEYLIEYFWDIADYFVLNISSPNTHQLRELQNANNLTTLLERTQQCRANLENSDSIPLWIKISPDLTHEECQNIARLCIEFGVQGIIATNTTTERALSLKNTHHAHEAGGLSGQPLFEKSTHILRTMYQLTEGAIPLIAVGGIASAEDLYTKIRAGASAAQLYSALAYGGLSVAGKILDGLIELLQKNGLNSIAEAVGKDA
jgi:dihydroorotate dehydrogenase